MTFQKKEKFTPQGTLYTNSRYCVSMNGWSEAGILKYNSLCKLAEDDRSLEHCRVFETLFKKKESESKVLKEQAIFKQEDFVQPYNNLISSSDDESSDDDSFDDDDDSDEIEPENGKANGVLPGKLIRGKQVCEVKTGISKISFFDRTIRLAAVKVARFFWGLSGKSMKTTIVPDG